MRDPPSNIHQKGMSEQSIHNSHLTADITQSTDAVLMLGQRRRIIKPTLGQWVVGSFSRLPLYGSIQASENHNAVSAYVCIIRRYFHI